MDPLDTIRTETVRLELMQVGSAIAQRARVDTVQDSLNLDMLTRRLTTYVLADHLVGDTYLKDYYEPSSWWQHLKRDHAPGWFLRRFPVKRERRTVTVLFDRYATYPKARVALPDLGGPIYIERVAER